MKVVFLNPPPVGGRAPDRNFGCNYGVTFQQPTHILYSAAILERDGHNVNFVDCPVEKLDESWCNDFIRTSVDAFVFFTVYLAAETDLYWAGKIIEQNKRAYIIFMGPEPTYLPTRFLLNERCFVIRGEPEQTIAELFSCLERGGRLEVIQSLSWLSAGRTVDNPPRKFIEDLDSIPFPARHLIKYPERYFNPKLKQKPSTTMFTSRQCWGRCTYCIPAAYNFAREIEGKRAGGRKPPVRTRSAENIYREFVEIKKLGYKSVAIMDDNFMGTKSPEDRERILKLCGLIESLKMEWGCLARADQLQDEEVLTAMKRAGCVYVDIGVESFNQCVLDYVKKDVKAGDQFNAIVLLKKVGIEPKVNILLGASPLQTEEDIKWTVKVLKMLDIDFVSFGVVIPHPALEFYKTVKENGWFATKSKDFEPVDPYSEATVDFPNISHEQLQRLVRWCYRSYYLRPSYIIRRLLAMRSPRELFENMRAAKNLFLG